MPISFAIYDELFMFDFNSKRVYVTRSILSKVNGKYALDEVSNKTTSLKMNSRQMK